MVRTRNGLCNPIRCLTVDSVDGTGECVRLNFVSLNEWLDISLNAVNGSNNNLRKLK